MDEQTKRVIVVFPEGSARVERFRSEFDPIAESIPAHITLVYPTAMTLARAREAMERAAEQCLAFGNAFSDIAVVDEEYLFLVAAAGQERIRLVHERLYRQLGEPLPASFVPHVTIARTSDRARLAKACSKARNRGLRLVVGIASHLCVYRIEAPDRRVREAIVSLASRTT